MRFEDVSALLAEARRRSGLTIRQLAAHAGTSHSAIAAYETGARSPNTATLQRSVEACGFSVETRLHPVGPFEDRVRRGRELSEVLDLADQFPSKHRAGPLRRFPD